MDVVTRKDGELIGGWRVMFCWSSPRGLRVLAQNLLSEGPLYTPITLYPPLIKPREKGTREEREEIPRTFKDRKGLWKGVKWLSLS